MSFFFRFKFFYFFENWTFKKIMSCANSENQILSLPWFVIALVHYFLKIVLPYDFDKQIL